ncbi:MAG: hypothetical protein EPO02_13125 [Nitrospirae bacterium]|nr:MAG: hypothetical protein EPO02_13125 [Nitrospirota bacterium]
MIRDGTVELLRTKRKVRSLRMRAEKRVFSAASNSRYDMAHRKRPIGQSHNNETDANPPGVWTIDRIPASTSQLFVFSISGKRAA